MSLRRATGQAGFTGDVVVPGMLHLALRRSPLAHARVVRSAATTVRALPGVAAVFVAGEGEACLPAVARFVGDRLAVAAAEEPELARRAADAVELELEPLPAVLDADRALADGACVAARVSVGEGDVEAEIAAAERVVEGEWSLPFCPAVPLEPPMAVTWLDEDRRLVVRTTADSPFRIRGALADRLSLPAARIRVVRPHAAGGSFGRGDMAVEDLCALVTLRTGRPARLALSAEEELTTTPGRPAQAARVRLGLTAGRIVALDVRLLVDLGADGDGADELLRAGGRHALGLYRARSVRFEATAVRTNRPPGGAPRGADAGAAFAVERAIDEAASALEEDASALRRRNLRSGGEAGSAALVALGEAPGRDDARPAAELLRAIERTAGGRPRRPGAAPSGPLRRGRAVAIARRVASREGRAAASTLRLLDDGSFTLAAGPSMAGADEAACVEAAAAILGVAPTRVVCAAADTDTAPFEAGDASPADLAPARAVEEAARLLHDAIRDAGAALLGVEPAQARVEGGRVRSEEREASFAEIGTAALRSGRPLAATAAPGAVSPPPSLAAAFAEVEVDLETGSVRATRLGAALTAGPLADPRPTEGQVEGALASALEQAVAGGLHFDPGGRPLVHSLRRWPLVAAGDVPPLSVVLVPEGDAASRAGAGALADCAGRAALAAIAGAVSLATGAPLRALPLTPGAVLSALAAARRGGASGER